MHKHKANWRECFDVWQNRKSLLWVSNAPFNDLEKFFFFRLEFLIPSLLEPFCAMEFDACFQLPYALWGEHVRKPHEFVSRMIPLNAVRLAFVCFSFLPKRVKDFPKTFSDSIWIGWWKGEEVDAQSIKTSFNPFRDCLSRQLRR